MRMGTLLSGALLKRMEGLVHVVRVSQSFLAAATEHLSLLLLSLSIGVPAPLSWASYQPFV